MKSKVALLLCINEDYAVCMQEACRDGASISDMIGIVESIRKNERALCIKEVVALGGKAMRQVANVLRAGL